MPVSSKPFYFAVVFWGKIYRRFFIDLALASLLSPNNIPALSNKKDSRFIVATTEEDWQSIQEEPLYVLLNSYIEVIYIKLSNPSENIHKMRMMSHGHKMVSETFFQNKAVGVFLTPDLVLSDGAVIALEKRISEGKKVVLCAAIRFEYHGCIQSLTNLGFLRINEPLVISSRQLMSVVLNHLHSESKTWLWDSPYYALSPVCTLWKLPGQSNYVLHGYSWAPIAVDYSTIPNHDTETFETSTLDQDYVYRNFGVSDDIYVVTDSDEIALASFTDEKDLFIPLVPHAAYKVPGLKNVINKDKLRRFHYCRIHGMDLLKRKLVVKSIFLHGEEIHHASYKIVCKVKRLVRASIKREPRGKEHIIFLIAQLHSLLNKKPVKSRRLLWNELKLIVSQIYNKKYENKRKNTNKYKIQYKHKNINIKNINFNRISRIFGRFIRLFMKDIIIRLKKYIKCIEEYKKVSQYYMKYINFNCSTKLTTLRSLTRCINQSNAFPLLYLYLFIQIKRFMKWFRRRFFFMKLKKIDE